MLNLRETNRKKQRIKSLCDNICLNSKNFGVPQNRERVFIIGHLRGRSGGTVFPIGGENEAVIKQLGNIVKSKGTFTDPQRGRVYSTNGISPCLNCMQGGGLEPKILEAIPVLTPDRAEKRQNGRRFKTNGEPSFTLTAQDRHGVAIKEATKTGYAIAEDGDSINLSGENSGVLVTNRKIGKEVNVSNTLGGRNPLGYMGNNQPITMIRESTYRIRRLTPLECWRLQGFPDWAFDRAREAGVSDSQLYKQAGNSVTVNVIKAIGERL